MSPTETMGSTLTVNSFSFNSRISYRGMGTFQQDSYRAVNSIEHLLKLQKILRTFVLYLGTNIKQYLACE